MTLAEFISVIRRWIWMLLAIVILVVGVTIINSARSPKSYKAETKVMSGLSQIADTSGSGASFVRGGGELSATYAELVTVQKVMASALEKAGLSWNEDTLKAKVDPVPSTEAPVLKINVTDSDPERAVLLANSVSEAFVEYIEGVNQKTIEDTRAGILNEIAFIEGQLADAAAGNTDIDVNEQRALQLALDRALSKYDDFLVGQTNSADILVVDPATSAVEQGINSTQRIILALIVGLVTGIVLAFIAEAVKTSLKQNDDQANNGKST